MKFAFFLSHEVSAPRFDAPQCRNASRGLRIAGTLFCLLVAMPSASMAFTPTDLPELALWLDATDSETIQVETGVAVWQDKSGHLRHVTQSNTAWQPAYHATGIEGHPAIDFDNTDDRLALPDAALLKGVEGASVFIVARPKSNNTAWGGYVAIYTTNQVRFLLSQTAPTGGGIRGLSASGRRLASDSLQQLVHSAGYSSNAFIGGMEADYANATLRVYYNGQGETRTPFQTPGKTEDNAGALHIGYVSNPLNALVGEIIVVESVVSTDTRQQVEGYLAWKWGLQSALPFGHPYHPDTLYPPILYDITFQETHNRNDVSIRIYTDMERQTQAGTAILTSNEGTAQKQLVDGQYYFTASLDGFKDYSGSFAVADSGMTISFELEPAPQVVTLSATALTHQSARITGELLSLGNLGTANVWFRHRQKTKVLHEGGIWTVHDRARALRHKQYTFIPWTNAKGEVGITQYDHLTNQTRSHTIGSVPNHVGDDHWGPAIFVRQDGRLLVPYSRTGGFVAISEHPLDINAWSITRYDWLRDYAQMMQIGNEIWMFYRPSGHFVGEWSYRVSTDQGQTWGTEKRLFKGAAADTGVYVHPFLDAANGRIHFGMGDHRQNEPGIYHWYLDLHDGFYYQSDGTAIHHAGNGSNPVTHTSQLTLAFEIPADWQGAKIWDVKVKNGIPYLGFAGYPEVDTAGGGGGDYRAMWAIWDAVSTSWQYSEIRKLGGSIGEGHYYEGGLVLDYEDPAHVYVSVETHGRNFQIQEWRTPDKGLSWEWVADHSPPGTNHYNPTKRARPVSPYKHAGGLPLVYWSGKYNDRFDHDTAIKASFQWETTPPVTFSEPQPFAFEMDGLYADTTYEFQAVVEQAGDLYAGHTLEFTTGPVPNDNQVLVVSQSGYNTSGALTNVSGSSSNYNTFLQKAWTNNRGGSCLDLFPEGTPAGTTSFYTIFGTDGTLRLNYSFNPGMQAATSDGSFRPPTPAADPRCILQGADSTSWMLTFNSIVDASTQSAFYPTLGIGSVGFTILPRNHATYPLDVRVKVTLSDSSTMTSTVAVGGSGSIVETVADRIGYFLTYTAPSGKTIASLTFETFQTNTTTPVSTRLALDQLGFSLPVPSKSSFIFIK